VETRFTMKVKKGALNVEVWMILVQRLFIRRVLKVKVSKELLLFRLALD
jgi:hypothetical protein